MGPVSSCINNDIPNTVIDSINVVNNAVIDNIKFVVSVTLIKAANSRFCSTMDSIINMEVSGSISDKIQIVGDVIYLR